MDRIARKVRYGSGPAMWSFVGPPSIAKIAMPSRGELQQGQNHSVDHDVSRHDGEQAVR